jgi:hypothetical protein
MMRRLDILEEEHATLMDIHEIIVHSSTKIELKVGWNVSEGGNKRDTEIVGLEYVQFLHELGREDGTKKKSLRKGKKTIFLQDESSEAFTYAKQVKDLDDSMLTNGEASDKLKNVCAGIMQAYTRGGENAQHDIGRAAEFLNHESVIKCLTKFSLVDPKLSKYLTAEDDISKKYYNKLQEVANKSFNVTYLFL